MTSVSVNGGDVMPAYQKLKHILMKEGIFVILKQKMYYLNTAEKKKYKSKQGYARRIKAKRAVLGQVDNND